MFFFEAFYNALDKAERMGRMKQQSVCNIISRYPTIMQRVLRIVSCLPRTQVFVERRLLRLKLASCENRERMGSDLIDGIVFMKANKVLEVSLDDYLTSRSQ